MYLFKIQKVLGGISIKGLFNDNESDIDLIGYNNYISVFKYVIDNSKDIINPPIVFGLHGDWGIGKSTFMKLLNKELKSNSYNITITINPWEYKEGEDIVSLFFIELYKVLKEKSLVEGLKDRFDNLFELIYPMKLKSTHFEYDVSKVKEIEKRNILDKYVDENHQKKENIKQLFEKTFLKGYKVIVFIDDLDRCSVDKVINILESVKLFLNTNKCVFFLGCDVNYLNSAVANHYEKFIKMDNEILNRNDKNNAIYNEKNTINRFTKEYLEKIIQVPFHIPQIDRKSMEVYIDSIIDAKVNNNEDMKKFYDILYYKGINFKKDIPTALIKELFSKRTINPRRIKRVLNIIYLNYLFLLTKMNSISKEDVCLLALLAIVNDEDSNFYKEKLSSKEICIETFNEKLKFINKADEEIDNDEHNDEHNVIEALFDAFFNYTGIASEKEIFGYMGNITNILTVSNTTNIISEHNNNWGKLGEIQSVSKTKRKLNTFLKYIDDETTKEFVLWFLKEIFMPAYGQGNLQIGIYNNYNVLIFKSKNYEIDDFSKCYLIKFNYDSQNKMLKIILDTGKYTSRLARIAIKQDINVVRDNIQVVKEKLIKEFEGVL